MGFSQQQTLQALMHLGQMRRQDEAQDRLRRQAELQALRQTGSNALALQAMNELEGRGGFLNSMFGIGKDPLTQMNTKNSLRDYSDKMVGPSKQDKQEEMEVSLDNVYKAAEASANADAFGVGDSEKLNAAYENSNNKLGVDADAVINYKSSPNAGKALSNDRGDIRNMDASDQYNVLRGDMEELMSKAKSNTEKRKIWNKYTDSVRSVDYAFNRNQANGLKGGYQEFLTQPKKGKWKGKSIELTPMIYTNPETDKQISVNVPKDAKENTLKAYLKKNYPTIYDKDKDSWQNLKRAGTNQQDDARDEFQRMKNASIKKDQLKEKIVALYNHQDRKKGEALAKSLGLTIDNIFGGITKDDIKGIIPDSALKRLPKGYIGSGNIGMNTGIK